MHVEVLDTNCSMIIFQVFEMVFFRKFTLVNLLKQIRLNQRAASDDINGPAKWLENAITYADVQTSFVDPCTSLPYPEKVNFLVLHE